MMTNNDKTCISAIRVLSAEAIQKAKSGHPGLPLGAADAAFALWAKKMVHNPADPKWENRDRFVLSSGHGSMLLYSLLHLSGYNVTLDDIKNFRQFGSLTPGHPEAGLTDGVEVSTGPLGQGIANAVGMAMAEAHLAARFNRPGFKVVDHRTYCLLGDGCMMEGISHEACSLAGTLKLNKLVALYDDNEISIEGNTDIAFRENVPARFKAYGWNVIDVKDGNDADAVLEALEKVGRAVKPTLIVCHTVIGNMSEKAGTAGVHGEPLGDENIAKLKQKLGWAQEAFSVPAEAYAAFDGARAAGAEAEEKWKRMVARYQKKYPELYEAWRAMMDGKDTYDMANDEQLNGLSGKMASRASSGKILSILFERIPALFGGSADLGPSNKTYVKGMGDFSCEDYAGRNIHFGVREHAMGAIANGIALHGGLKPFVSTFFVFSDYMKNAIRMASLMGLGVTYVFTHDSIGVGEDGPTHQPVEQLVAMRSIPGLTVFRPADVHETLAGWTAAVKMNKPVALVLTRQDLKELPENDGDPLKGAYIVSDSAKETPDVILIGTGSEVELCLEAKELLKAKGVDARVVSMPSWELFDAQSEAYRRSVLPDSVRARVAVEAASGIGWDRYVGLDGAKVTMDTFGASAPAGELFKHFGFTAENICEKALKTIR